MKKEICLKLDADRSGQLINLLNYAIKVGGYDTALVAVPFITDIVKLNQELENAPKEEPQAKQASSQKKSGN